MTTNGLFLLLVFVTMTTKTNGLIFPKRRLKIEKIKHRPQKMVEGPFQSLGNVLACFYSSPSSACYSDVGQVPTRPTRVVVHAPTRVNTRVPSNGLNVAKNINL
jgi:hypothetical protein